MQLYYLIYRLLLSGPCGQAGRALEQNLRENSQLLPQTMNHAGVLEPVSLERLVCDFLHFTFYILFLFFYPRDNSSTSA